jgi:hypothetical protein
VLFSRFGVMFFEDPSAALTNLRRALRPGGRLSFVCFRGLEENEWMAVPFAAASAVVKPKAPLPGPTDPGPLAFADGPRVRGLLERAGFTEVGLAPFDHLMPLGDGKGLDAATAEALTFGPTGRLMMDQDDAAKARGTTAVRGALAPYAKGNDVALMAAAWVVTATNR